MITTGHGILKNEKLGFWDRLRGKTLPPEQKELDQFTRSHPERERTLSNLQQGPAKSTQVNTPLINAIFARYDHNRNGSIEYAKSETLENLGLSEGWETSDTGFMETTRDVHSFERFFVAADSNADGKVTPEEAFAVTRHFDKDGDGQVNQSWFVPSAEARAFIGKYPETQHN